MKNYNSRNAFLPLINSTIIYEVISIILLVISGNMDSYTGFGSLGFIEIFFLVLYLLTFSIFYSLFFKKYLSIEFINSKAFFVVEFIIVIGLVIIGAMYKFLLLIGDFTIFILGTEEEASIAILGYIVLYIIVDAIVSLIIKLHQMRINKK